MGEDHANAVLTDAEVELIRTLREEEGMSYSVLAKKFGIGRSTAADICRYRRRAQLVARWARVPKEEKGGNRA